MEAVLEAAEGVEDLGLDGDVQGGDRLVGDDQVGLAGEGAGDADALALAAAELMGEAAGLGGVEADEFEKLVEAAANLGCAAHPPDAQGKADDLLDGLVGVEGGEGVLEDHLHARTEVAKVRGREGEEVDAVEPDAAPCGLFEAADETAEGALAAAALAHKAEGLAPSDLKGDAIDGPQDAVLPGRKVLGQVFGSEEGVIGCHARRSHSSSSLREG